MCKKCIAKRIITPIVLTPFLLAAIPATQYVSISDIVAGKDKTEASSWFDTNVQAREVKEGKAKWTCPMHPHYIADEFGTCPICGMDLVKLQSTNSDPDNSSGEKREQITVSPEIMQSMGIRIAKAEIANFGRSIRSYGVIEANERLRLELSARVDGWVQDLNITAVGDVVKKDDILFTLYSPELVVSQNDYLSTLKGSGERRSDTITRLVNFGVQPRAIEKMKKEGKAMNSVPFYAVQPGTVSELMVTAGSFVKRGTMIAKIQDYSKVWIVVNVSEKDMSFISEKTIAQITFPTIPGKTIQAKVDYIYPTMNVMTRTGKVRLVIDNKDGKLRPGTYADITFQVDTEQRLSIPTESILKNESGNHVVVSLGQGRFEPRQIQLGLHSGTWSEVTEGLKKGEDIVVSGQFLLDSESALRESFRKLQRLQLALSLLKPDKNDMALIDHMVDAAIYLHEVLANGYNVEPKYLAPALAVKEALWPGYKNTKLSFILVDAESSIKQAQSAKTRSELRIALNALIKALKPWMQEGAPEHYRNRKVTLYEEDKTGNMWIQTGGKSINPYSHKSATPIPWKVKQETEKTQKKISKNIPAPLNSVRGSHGG